jgi:hypothetical protein
MPKASALILRNPGSSQLPSNAQVWLVAATDGTVCYIGFDKEFIKKHLFVDPDPSVPPDAKAQRIVGKVQRYGAPAEPLPATADLATLRYLKLKKMVLARVSQGKCSACNHAETKHKLVCANCGHRHKKAWVGGGLCGTAGCACTAWADGPRTQCETPGCVCGLFVGSNYEQDRSAAGKPNPFGGSGGACTGTNTVLLMDAIDLQDFKDTVVSAIRASEATGWPAGTKKEGEGLPLDFGATNQVAATIQSNDTLASFNARAKGRGIKVFVKKTTATPPVYQIFHFHAMIA